MQRKQAKDKIFYVLPLNIHVVTETYSKDQVQDVTFECKIFLALYGFTHWCVRLLLSCPGSSQVLSVEVFKLPVS